MHNFILKSPKTATFVFLLDTDGSEILAFNAENGYQKPYFASSLIDLSSDILRIRLCHSAIPTCMLRIRR